ncbi:DUF3634 family protein [Celerinatantimonas yamalensis]|uniref:DUF3634 family protein n=1 Tax=Celerinatantimonas yamalensis TaxID=559956 RepID=A0ABW9G2J7_9GAMM
MIGLYLMLLGGALLIGYWRSLGRYTFVLLIETDKVRILKGHVPESFLTLCQTVSRLTPVKHRIIIRGDRHDGQLRLTFSREVDECMRQQLRHQFPYSAYGIAQLDWRIPRRHE